MTSIDESRPNTVVAQVTIKERFNDSGDGPKYYGHVIPGNTEHGALHSFFMSDLGQPRHARAIDEFVSLYLSSHPEIPEDGWQIEMPRKCFESPNETLDERHTRYSYLVMELGDLLSRQRSDSLGSPVDDTSASPSDGR
jgi:hypothetical protein